jgi:hypothetical protein
MPGSLQPVMQQTPAADTAQQHLAEHAAAAHSSSSSSRHTIEAMMQQQQQLQQQQQQAPAAAVAGATSVRTSTAGQWDFSAAEEVRDQHMRSAYCCNSPGACSCMLRFKAVSCGHSGVKFTLNPAC